MAVVPAVTVTINNDDGHSNRYKLMSGDGLRGSLFVDPCRAHVRVVEIARNSGKERKRVKSNFIHLQAYRQCI